MSRKFKYRLSVTVATSVVFLLLFGLVRQNPPHKRGKKQHEFTLADNQKRIQDKLN